MKALLFALLVAVSCDAAVLSHLKKMEKKGSTSIEGIGCIYLINLDARPEKLERSLAQLSRYQIVPERFSGIYGWSLSLETLDEVGLVYEAGMWPGREPVHFSNFLQGYLNNSLFGHTCFSYWTSLGAVGCTLSHLSVLKDALDANYATAWVMEDDIVVDKDPREITAYIEELESYVGPNGWDILYTDPHYLNNIDLSRDLLQQLPWMWRPDMPHFDLQRVIRFFDFGRFVKIGSRIRAHSLIVSRSGMEKILRFYETHGIFMPYDHEIFFVPDIQVYVIKESLVTAFETTSDTREQHFK